MLNMPSQAGENSFKTMYKSRREGRDQASIASRRKSVRMERKHRKDDKINHRRGILGMSTLSESNNTSDLDLDLDLHEDVQLQSSQSTQTNSKPKTTGSGTGRAVGTDPRSLSLKERLQKWREEKKKLSEQKKTQPPAFVVKSVEHKSDFNLFNAAQKNAKKLPLPELNMNFVEMLKNKPVQQSRKQVKSSLEKRSPATKSRHLSKPGQTEIKKVVPTRAQATRVTRQAVKAEEPNEKSGDAKRTLIQGTKSLVDLHFSAHDSKPKSRPLRGDLHLRLTAAAAAKKEGREKPREFLRAKSHRIVTGRATRSQTKQEKSESDVQVSCLASSTLSHSTSEMMFPSQSKGQLPDQRQTRVSMDADSEVIKELNESPLKRRRRATAKETLKNDRPEESIVPEDEPTDTDDQSEKVKSVQKARRSVLCNAEREEQACLDKNALFSKTGKNLTSNVLSDMNQAGAVSQPEGSVDEVETPGKKLRSSNLMVSSSEEEHMVMNSRDAATPVRRSRRSNINTASAVRTSRRSVAKSVFDTKEESINVSDFGSVAAVKQKFNDEIEKSTSEDEQLIGLKLKATPNKRARRSVLETSTIQEGQIQERQKIVLSQKRGRQSVIKTVLSTDEEEITNLAVIFTPGKSPRRSVLKVPADEETQSDSSTSSLQLSAIPDRKSQRLVARLSAVSNVGQADSKSESDSNINSCQMKQTPSRKSRRSVSSSLTVDEFSLIDENSVSDTRTNDSQIKAMPQSQHLGSESVAVNEPGLRGANPESDSSSTKKKRIATPVRKSRRSVATPAATDKLDILSANSDSDSDISNNCMKVTPGRKSRRSFSKPQGSDPAFTNVKPGPTNSQIKPITNISQRIENFGDAARLMEENLMESKEESHPDVDCPIDESRQYNKMTPLSSKLRRTSGSGIGNSGSKRRSGKKTPKSVRRQSRARSRSSATPSAFSPFSRRSRSISTVVSVSEEGTSNWKGELVVDQASTPNSSFAENKFPVNECERRRRSVRRSMTKSITQKEEVSDSSVYRLAKPASIEAETGPLQELTVEKVEGESSYIEVPLDESSLDESESSAKKASPINTGTLRLEESTDSNKGATSSISSVETEPFTPRKSCNVTRGSQETMLSVEATPDLPPRVHVRGFKTPFQAPRSAVLAKGSSSRPRRKTEQSTPLRSPEEVIKMLERSPMIEMTRRRSRHVSSPASIVPKQLDVEEKPLSSADISSPKLNGIDPDPKECLDGELASGSAASNPYVMERVKHFRNILATETDRLNQLCKTWDEIVAYTFDVGEDVLGQIRTSVGKAQLLISKRFKQFSRLVDNCEFNLGEQKTRPEDLQGFWEMIYFQVEDVNDLFGQLKTLQDNNWEKPKSPRKLNLKKKPVASKASKPRGVSNFKAFREEMMKRKAQKTAASKQEDNAVVTDSSASTSKEQKQSEQPNQNLEFDGIFFKVISPAKTPRGKRTTLGSHTNSPEAAAPDLESKPTEITSEIDSQSSKPPNSTTIPVVANKENQETHNGAATAVLTASQNTALGQAKFGMSVKRLSYVPVIPSPLLKDTTGITTPKK